MRTRLADSLALVLPALDPALASPDAVGKLGALACALAPVHRAGFECRLDGDDARVDLQQGVIATPRERAMLAAYIDDAARGAPLGEAWQGVRRLVAAWSDPESPLHEGIAELWLEFDVPDRAGDACTPDGAADVVPSVFALFAPGVSTAAASATLARHVLARLVHPGEASRLGAEIARLAQACEERERITHVGVMLGRAYAGCRVHVSHVALRRMPAYLERAGWPGDGAQVHAVARSMFDYVDNVVLCLDVGASVLPRLGIECFFTQKHGVDPRWEPLLDHLIARGLATASKRDALLAWPGRIEPTRAAAPWPADLIAESLLRPADWFGTFERRLSHVKLTLCAGRPASAKAYFGYGHLWHQAGVVPRDEERTTSPVETARPGVSGIAAATRIAIGDAIRAATSFLLGARTQGGWWRDFYDLGRRAEHDRRVTGYASDEWVSAYIGAMLARVDDDERAREAARETWSLLEARRGAPHGWGYHALLPSDADSTVWALRLARALGVAESPRLREAHCFVERQMRADGGVMTYRPEDCARIAHYLRMEGPYDGWCASHTCVTAAAAALDLGDAPIRHLLRVQRADGAWAGHWWDDDEYATLRAVEALAPRARDGDEGAARAVHRAAAWAAARIAAHGAVRSDAHGGDSAFATALALGTLAVGVNGAGAGPGAAVAADEAHVRAAMARAARWLVAAQRSSGAYAPSARLRVPAPSAIDPLASPATTLTYLDRNALFTTATVVAALVAAREA